MDEQKDVFVFESEPKGGGKFKVTARWQENPVHIDTLNPAVSAQRKRFIKALCEVLPEAESDAIEAELLKVKLDELGERAGEFYRRFEFEGADEKVIKKFGREFDLRRIRLQNKIEELEKITEQATR